jgi:hypothetical protein
VRENERGRKYRRKEEEEERRKRAVFPLPNQTQELEREVSCVFFAQTRLEIREKGKEGGLFCLASREKVSERETELERERGQWHFPATGNGISSVITR